MFYTNGAAIVQALLIPAIGAAAQKIFTAWRRVPGWACLMRGSGWFGYRLVR